MGAKRGAGKIVASLGLGIIGVFWLGVLVGGLAILNWGLDLKALKAGGEVVDVDPPFLIRVGAITIGLWALLSGLVGWVGLRVRQRAQSKGQLPSV